VRTLAEGESSMPSILQLTILIYIAVPYYHHLVIELNLPL
jgi:hypothetical protein